MKNLNQNNLLKTISLAAFAMLFCFFMSGCSKKNQGCMNTIALNFDKNAEEDDGSCLLAGKGGQVTIVAYPQHHGAPITSVSDYRDTAYVKFNTREFPGTSPALYDLVIIGEKNEAFVNIKRLKPGNYFIYMTGLDTSSPIPERVTGGIPVSFGQSYGELLLAVPVTE